MNIKKIKFKTYTALILGLILLLTALFVFLFPKLKDIPIPKAAAFEHVIKLTKKGFEPHDLTINKGDTVKFVTTENSSFWPASDPHPTHEYLNGFDPLKPILSGSSWSFTFLTAGTWRYHNHLDPNNTGNIEVLDESGNSTAAQASCPKGEGSDQCWYTKIKETVKTKGIDAAFELFSQVYSDGTPLACHWTAHLIGNEAFELFRQGKDFKITKATSYCGYGFYHGFMEPLLRDNPDPKLALDFCNKVGQQLGSEGQDNCYHGIGHGFTEEPPDKKIWGDADAMLKPGLAVCEKLFGQTANKWETCATGVYTVIAKFIAEEEYGLTFDPKDPFNFCRTQPKRYSVACYGEFAPKLDYILNWDVSKIPNYITGITDDYTTEIVIRGAIGAMLQRDVGLENHDTYVNGCRSFPEKWRQICFKGIVWGFIMHGIPEKEYIQLFKFCQAQILSDGERSYCFQESLSRLKSVYSPQNMFSVCAIVPEANKQQCLSNS